MTQRRGQCCKIGKSKYAQMIDSLRDQHFPLSKIYNWCQLKGVGVSKETVIRHFKEHYMSDPNRPAYVPTCKVCMANLIDEFRDKYFRGDPVDGLVRWLNILGLTVTEANVLTHIQHRALKGLAKEQGLLLLEPSAETDWEESSDAHVEDNKPPVSDIISVEDEIKKLILIKKARVQRRLKLDAHTPTVETRRELESLEKTLVEYNRLRKGKRDDIKHRRADLVTIMTKELNLVVSDLDAENKEQLIAGLKKEIKAKQAEIAEKEPKGMRTAFILPAAPKVPACTEIAKLLSESNKMVVKSPPDTEES